LNGRLKGYLAVLFAFCLGNSSNAFLLLKAQQRGFSASGVILMYLIFNVAASALAIPAAGSPTGLAAGACSSPDT
jgi:hypothetical protein